MIVNCTHPHLPLRKRRLEVVRGSRGVNVFINTSFSRGSNKNTCMKAEISSYSPPPSVLFKISVFRLKEMGYFNYGEVMADQY